MTTALMTADTQVSGTKLNGKYLTFILGDEFYAIPVLKVREIIRLANITTIPQMPNYIRGVINLRGKIIPVMDVRMCFGMPEIAHSEQACIVVVHVKTAEHPATAMGLMVDGVEEVAQIAANDTEAAPDFGSQVAASYLLGMAKIKGVVISLLDIDMVIASAAASLNGTSSPATIATQRNSVCTR